VDILAHALYGATLCSRSGFAGGRRPAALPRTWWGDWSVWAAAGFGALPDITSIGLYFIQILLRGDSPSFHSLPQYVYIIYHCTHSLVIFGLPLIIIWAVARPLVIPALAWPLHIIMDSVSHGNGKWQTLMFYPVTDWHYHGLNWWQHPGVISVYWMTLPVLWIGIYLWRRTSSV